MRADVVPAVLVLLAGCGRLGFDAAGEPDARPGDAALSYSAQVLADQPRTYYRLGDPVGTKVIDSAGDQDAETGATNGGVIEFGRAGALAGDTDTAILFDADGNAGPRFDAWSEFPAVVSTWSGDFTIELLVRPLSIPPPSYHHSLLICENYLTNGFRTGITRSLFPELWTTQAGASSSVTASVGTPVGVWTHLAYTKRGATVEIFVDGQGVASDQITYNVPDSTANCGFGSFQGEPSNVELDEVAIYDRALTEPELAAHAAAAR